MGSHSYTHSHLKLLLFVFLWFFRLGKSDLTSEKTALLALQAAAGGKIFQWDETQSTPCTWKGVACENNHVTVLRLPGAGLSGEIPVGIFGNLTNLRVLSLRLNALSGHLPSDLALCTNLRNLYLQGNHFSGEIPEFLFILVNLVRLNIAGNHFSGGISPLLNNLDRLSTLYLEKNQLSGSIPELNLPNLTQFNVSFNRLSGSIPFMLRSMRADAFIGNSLCGQPLDPCH